MAVPAASQGLSDIDAKEMRASEAMRSGPGVDGESKDVSIADSLEVDRPQGPGAEQGEWFLHKILKDQYNTKNLATAATLIRNATQNNSQFVWTTGERRGDLPRVGTVAQLLKARNMACYEFVHYAAYFAGHQPFHMVFDDIPDAVYDEDPLISTPDLLSRGFEQRPGVMMSIVDRNIIKESDRTVWDRSAPIPRGMVVYGVSRIGSYNNKGGYYHVGISIGGNNIISLHGNDGSGDLDIQSAGDLFGRLGYSEVIYGPYNYSAQPSR